MQLESLALLTTRSNFPQNLTLSSSKKSQKLGFSAVNASKFKGKKREGRNWEDVSSALNNCRRESYLLLSAKYCDDINCAIELRNIVANKIINELKIVENLAINVAVAIIWPLIWQTKCDKCNGTTINVRTGRDCKKCEGSGASRLSVREYAKIAGVSKDIWHRKYVGLLPAMTLLLQNWETEGQEALLRCG